MVHKWLESLVDTLLYLGLIMGLLMFSAYYWKNAYQTRTAELVIEEFLNDVSKDGGMSVEELEGLLQRIYTINPAYEVELAYKSYKLQPCYAQISVETLDSYYMKRNERKEVTFQAYKLEVQEENAEWLRFQEETNASIMAAEEYLPLPEEEAVLQVEAVRKQQEVYEGEELITVCRVISKSGSYYVEATPVTAVNSGTVVLEVVVESAVQYVPIEVTCYPRVVKCAKGHSVVNTVEVVEIWKQNSTIKCPYCEVIPEKLSCNVDLIMKRTGEKLEQKEIWLEVVYLDGHMEVITPMNKEWQDDYDESYCGIQPVTISYRGKNAVITVISENGACKACGEMCGGRSFSDYVRFPYCTGCMSKVLLFTGEVYEEEYLVQYEELTAELDRNRDIAWQKGDMIIVKLSKNKNIQLIRQKIIKRDGKSG